jgi:transposase InsO family protein
VGLLEVPRPAAAARPSLESQAGVPRVQNDEAEFTPQDYIQPGKSNQNAYIERFNQTFRHEVLDAYVFESLSQVREITRHWINEYNEERPHHSLGKIPPAMFRRQAESARNSTLELCT